MKNLILVFLSVILLSACKTLVPFTQDLKNDNGWKEAELKQIQFYASNSIVLHRQLSQSETAIESGKIKIRNGKKVEEIIIKKGTPGVLTSMPDGKRMAISFEIDDSHYLTFGPYSNKGDRYYLMLKEFKKNQYAKVTYVDKAFYIAPESLNAFLQIDIKKILKEDRKQRVAGGRKI
ncbi:MAG: hypothetical protein ACPGVH_02170 [Chitinophagales bacterium]